MPIPGEGYNPRLMAKELSPAGQRILLSVVCLIFISVGLAIWIPNFLLPVLDWSARKKWKETLCTILRGPGGQGETFDLGIAFRYEVDGLTLDSADAGSLDFFSDAGRSLRNLKPGSETVCYVDPRPPHKAVLSRDFDPETFIWCAPLLFVILPGFALVAGLMNIGKRTPSEPPAEGVVVLGSGRGSKGCSLLFQLGFLLFFGGIATLLVYLPGFRELIVVRLVYLVPIGLLTLLLLRGFVRTLFRSYGPGLLLTVTPGVPAPGQTVEVRWESKSVSDRTKYFRITLEGREEIRTRVGRRDQVEKAVFETLDVGKGGPKDLRRGTAKFSIPASAMPTFEHGSRHIAWIFRLAGEIPGVDKEGEEYPFEIAVQKGKPS